MEKLSAIVAQQSRGSSELALPGTQQLTRESLVHLGTLLRQMSAAFPHQEYSEETAEVFLMSFEDLALKYGLKSLEWALRGFLTKQKFFPHPAEVAEELERMQQKTRQEQMQSLPKVGCDLCADHGNSGLIGVLGTDSERYMKPCECLLAYRRAKKQMGVA